jgi:hypothetical protein
VNTSTPASAASQENEMLCGGGRRSLCGLADLYIVDLAVMMTTTIARAVRRSGTPSAAVCAAVTCSTSSQGRVRGRLAVDADGDLAAAAALVSVW